MPTHRPDQKRWDAGSIRQGCIISLVAMQEEWHVPTHRQCRLRGRAAAGNRASAPEQVHVNMAVPGGQSRYSCALLCPPAHTPTPTPARRPKLL